MPRKKKGEWDSLSPEQRVAAAADFILNHAGYDGAHHKAWVLDGALRILTGADYDRLVREYQAGEDGPETYEWDVGVPP